MTLLPYPWLLRLVVLCHLAILLEGQHHGVRKCRITCNKMTSIIPVANLVGYEWNQPSCGKLAIILETKKHRFFCADPAEKWVQEAKAYLDHQPAVLTPNGGTFEKQIGAAGEPRTTPAAGEAPQYATPEGQAAAAAIAGESGNPELTPPPLETQKAWGTSPELPTRGAAGSSGTGSPSASEAEGEGLPAGPGEIELLSTAAAPTTLPAAGDGQRSVTYQPGPDLWAEGKTPEGSPTQGPPTKALTASPPAPEDRAGPEGRVEWVEEQSPVPENRLEPETMGPGPTHTDAFLDWGPGSMAHASPAPASSEKPPSREPGAVGSWAPKVDEPIHATMDPQRLGVLVTPVPDTQAATRRQAVGLLAFLGLLFCLGVAMFAYQSLQGCSRKMAGDMVEGLRYVPRSCGSNSYVLVPV